MMCKFDIYIKKNFFLKKEYLCSGKSPIVELVSDLDQAFRRAEMLVKEDGRIFMLGGQTLYEQSIDLPECTHVLITNVYSSVPVPCDTFIPKIDPSVFRLATHEELELFLKESVPMGKHSYENFEYEFILYIRK